MGKPSATMLASRFPTTTTDEELGAVACFNILSSCGLGSSSSSSSRAGINALLLGGGDNRMTSSSSSSASATSQHNVVDGVNVNPKETDALLAKEMNNLSIEQRDRVFDEVHGVANDIDETPEMIESALQELQEEILRIRKRQAYDRAAFVSPSYVHNRKFRLMFLRSEYFNPKKAAKRIVLHFHHKLDLFGFDALVRSITLQDLNNDDIEAMSAGAIQVLPIKDKAGRTIVCNFHQQHNCKTTYNQLRVVWYTVMSALEADEVTQRKGLVNIIYNVGNHNFTKIDKELMVDASFINDCIPMRYASMHFCYDNPKLKPLMNIIQYVVGTEARIRFRAHYGTHLEVQYALMTYGVLAKSLPVDTSGVLDLSMQRDFEAKCVENEQAMALYHSHGNNHHDNDQDDIIDIPLSKDVVLGRGYPYQQFPGNLRLAILIDQHRATYQSSNRPKKTEISNMIVRTIKQSNGRFITKRNKDDENTSSNNNGDDGGGGQQGWVVVSDEVARDKVSHGFRTKTKKNGVVLLKEAMGGDGSLLSYGKQNDNKPSSGSEQQPDTAEAIYDSY